MTARNSSSSNQRTVARDLDTPLRTTLVRVDAGVAAGSTKRGSGNA
jgi:hypothetical protein